MDRDALTQMLMQAGMRGNAPGDMGGASGFQRTLPQDWKTEGWPKQPNPQELAEQEGLFSGMTGPPGPPMGYPLENRRRMPPGIVPDRRQAEMEMLMEQMRKPPPPGMPRPGLPLEQLAPRQYGQGQMI